MISNSRIIAVIILVLVICGILMNYTIESFESPQFVFDTIKPTIISNIDHTTDSMCLWVTASDDNLKNNPIEWVDKSPSHSNLINNSIHYNVDPYIIRARSNDGNTLKGVYFSELAYYQSMSPSSMKKNIILMPDNTTKMIEYLFFVFISHGSNNNTDPFDTMKGKVHLLGPVNNTNRQIYIDNETIYYGYRDHFVSGYIGNLIRDKMYILEAGIDMDGKVTIKLNGTKIEISGTISNMTNEIKIGYNRKSGMDLYVMEVIIYNIYSDALTTFVHNYLKNKYTSYSEPFQTIEGYFWDKKSKNKNDNKEKEAAAKAAQDAIEKATREAAEAAAKATREAAEKATREAAEKATREAAEKAAEKAAKKAAQDAKDAAAKAVQDAIDAKAKAVQDAIDAKAVQDAIDAKAKAVQDAKDAAAKAKKEAEAAEKAKKEAEAARIEAERKAAEAARIEAERKAAEELARKIGVATNDINRIISSNSQISDETKIKDQNNKLNGLSTDMNTTYGILPESVRKNFKNTIQSIQGVQNPQINRMDRQAQPIQGFRNMVESFTNKWSFNEQPITMTPIYVKDSTDTFKNTKRITYNNTDEKFLFQNGEYTIQCSEKFKLPWNAFLSNRTGGSANLTLSGTETIELDLPYYFTLSSYTLSYNTSAVFQYRMQYFDESKNNWVFWDNLEYSKNPGGLAIDKISLGSTNYSNKIKLIFSGNANISFNLGMNGIYKYDLNTNELNCYSDLAQRNTTASDWRTNHWTAKPIDNINYRSCSYANYS